MEKREKVKVIKNKNCDTDNWFGFAWTGLRALEPALFPPGAIMFCFFFFFFVIVVVVIVGGESSLREMRVKLGINLQYKYRKDVRKNKNKKPTHKSIQLRNNTCW